MAGDESLHTRRADRVSGAELTTSYLTSIRGLNVGALAMEPEDELVGLRRRLARIQQSLEFIHEPLATALLHGIATDIEARIAAVESGKQGYQDS